MKADTELDTRSQRTLQLLKYLFLVQQALNKYSKHTHDQEKQHADINVYLGNFKGILCYCTGIVSMVVDKIPKLTLLNVRMHVIVYPKKSQFNTNQAFQLVPTNQLSS